MKKSLLILMLSFSFSFADCWAFYNSLPTCVSVQAQLGATMMSLTRSFNNTLRGNEILKHSKALNKKIMDLNEINANVYKELQAIIHIDNKLVLKGNEQIFLLEKISKFEDIINAQKALLIKKELISHD